MLTPSAYTLATLLVPPLCLLVVLIALALFWRKVRRRLRLLAREPASLELYAQEARLPLQPRSRVGGEREEDEEGGGSGDEGLSRSRERRTRRSSTLSICTTLAVDGTRVLARRERVLSAEMAGTSEGEGEGRGRSSFFLPSSVGSLAREGRATRSTARGEDEGEEATEELAAAGAGSASDSLQDEPPSAEWMRRSFASPRSLPSREVAQGDEEARLGRRTSSSLFLVDPEAEDALSDFIRLLEPVAPPRASRTSGRRSGNVEDEEAEVGRSPSGTTNGSEGTGPPLSSPATSPPHSPPPLPYPPPLLSTHHPSYPSAAALPSHPYLPPRPSTRSTPTPLPSDSALLRSSSSPELRPYRHARRTTDPLATWSVFSAPETSFSPLYPKSYPYPSGSTGLYPTSVARPGWPGSESTLFSPASPAPPQPLPLASSSSPTWPPSPPRTPHTPSSPCHPAPSPPPPPPASASPPLTDFPLPTLPRRPPCATRPAHLPSYTLPSSSFGAPSSPTAAPAATSMSGSRWSFRRRSTSSSLRWSGSWGKKSRASAAEAAREREWRVSKELLAPLSASTKPSTGEVPPTPPLPLGLEEESEVVQEQVEGKEKGHARESSVGTLESWVARGLGKVGGGEGGELTLTNPDPSLPSSSFPSSRRPSVDLSVHTSVRLSFVESER